MGISGDLFTKPTKLSLSTNPSTVKKSRILKLWHTIIILNHSQLKFEVKDIIKVENKVKVRVYGEFNIKVMFNIEVMFKVLAKAKFKVSCRYKERGNFQGWCQRQIKVKIMVAVTVIVKVKTYFLVKLRGILKVSQTYSNDQILCHNHIWSKGQGKGHYQGQCQIDIQV